MRSSQGVNLEATQGAVNAANRLGFPAKDIDYFTRLAVKAAAVK